MAALWPEAEAEPCTCRPVTELVHAAVAGEPPGACAVHRPGQPADADSAALNDDDALLASLRAALNIPTPEEN
jgi:hypothetical protein